MEYTHCFPILFDGYKVNRRTEVNTNLADKNIQYITMTVLLLQVPHCDSGSTRKWPFQTHFLPPGIIRRQNVFGSLRPFPLRQIRLELGLKGQFHDEWKCSHYQLLLSIKPSLMCVVWWMVIRLIVLAFINNMWKCKLNTTLNADSLSKKAKGKKYTMD